jgi:hypothetical protein
MGTPVCSLRRCRSLFLICGERSYTEHKATARRLRMPDTIAAVAGEILNSSSHHGVCSTSDH